VIAPAVCGFELDHPSVQSGERAAVTDRKNCAGGQFAAQESHQPRFGALVECGRGRFWLRRSDAARALRDRNN